MKNRKIVVIAFTLIAVLLLGVGYAAVTDDLKILGHVKTNMETITSDFQLDVRFKDGSGTVIRDDTNPTDDPTFVGRAHAKVDSVNDTSMDTAAITIENFTVTIGKKNGEENRKLTNVWYDISPLVPWSKERVKHPTQKPVQLMERCVKLWSNEGDTILDFTMGSGSTGVACKNLNRDFIGIELNEEYFKIAKERIEKAQA